MLCSYYMYYNCKQNATVLTIPNKKRLIWHLSHISPTYLFRMKKIIIFGPNFEIPTIVFRKATCASLHPHHFYSGRNRSFLLLHYSLLQFVKRKYRLWKFYSEAIIEKTHTIGSWREKIVLSWHLWWRVYTYHCNRILN